MTSSDGAFNAAIASKSRGQGIAGSYSFYPIEDSEKMEYVNYFRKTYLGLAPTKAAPQPASSTFDTFGEEDSKKSKKKKKGDEVTDAGFGVPPVTTQEEESKSKKKKKEKKGEGGPDIDPVKN